LIVYTTMLPRLSTNLSQRILGKVSAKRIRITKQLGVPASQHAPRVQSTHPSSHPLLKNAQFRHYSAPRSKRPLLMIPGPIEVDEEVLAIMGEPPLSHVSPGFIEEFGQAIQRTREIFLSKDGQPFILSGSGALGWDFISANFVAPGEKVLVISTGYFSDRWADCLKSYKADVTVLKADVIGDRPSNQELEQALKGNDYKMVTITHVDTSTSVLTDVKSYADIIRKHCPKALICADGVCSVAAEEFRMSDWEIDVMMTASQKALGAPPGLAILVVGPRAMNVFNNRTTPVLSCYANLANWLPIMKAYESRKPAYFGTPAVNTVRAYNLSLTKILAGGLEQRFKKHDQISLYVKTKLISLGLELVPTSLEKGANTLTAVRYPKGVTAPELLPKISENGVVVAGGIHPKIAAEYFRLSHMGISVMEDKRGHIDTMINAIDKALKALNIKHVASQ